MARKPLTAALNASAKRNPRREESTEEKKAPRRAPRLDEPTHLIAFRVAVSIDDQVEETVLRVNQAARAAGRANLKKRELMELALRHLLRLSPGEILDLVGENS